MMIEASLHLRSFTKEDRNPQLYSAHSSPMNGSWREYYLISFFSDYSLASLSISLFLTKNRIDIFRKGVI